MESGRPRNVLLVSLSQFGMAFSSNYISVFLPFFILTISPYSQQKTLLWIGFVMGVSHLVTTVASNFWGILTARFSPKMLYLRGLLSNSVLFLLMGFTTNLHLLFLLRVFQGIFGGISTIGLIFISASSPRERLSADIGFFQTFITLGFLLGPLLGAWAASIFGYRGAFLSASVILACVLTFCYTQLQEIPHSSREGKFFSRGTMNARSILGWLLSFGVNVQLMFLPSILPQVFERFQIEKSIALKWAGVVIMLYTATATFGTYFWSKLSVRIRHEKLIPFLVMGGSLCQLLLFVTDEVAVFVVIRMVQTGLIAATVPLIISIFAAELKGGTIGFLNSSRFAGNALGPIIATSVLAYSNLTTLCLLLSGMTLLTLLGFRATLRHA
jgi:MFS family permease